MSRYHSRLVSKGQGKTTIDVMDQSKAIVIIVFSGCFIIAMLVACAGDKF